MLKKFKLEKEEIKNLNQGITLTQKIRDKYDQHFTYGLSKNLRFVKNEVESIADAEKEKLKKYGEALDKLNEKYAKKNEKGSPEMTARGVTIDPDFVYDYNKALKKLDEETFKKVLDENKKFLKEKVDIELYLISNKHFPNTFGDVADSLFPIRMDPLEEEKEEKAKEKDKSKKKE